MQIKICFFTSHMPVSYSRPSQVVPVVKNLPANGGDARDTGLIHELGRSPGEGNGNPLQYSSLENSMDRGAWQASVHGTAKRQTRLSAYMQNLSSPKTRTGTGRHH